jgi:nucleotide-binding universal stress UspA family protein
MGMFTTILVAMDESDAGHEADGYATELAKSFGGSVTRCKVTSSDGGRRAARDQQVVAHVAEAAAAVGADVIVLGLDRRRLEHHRLSPSLRERVTESALVPVLVPPVSPSGMHEPAGHLTSRRLQAVKRSLQHV